MHKAFIGSVSKYFDFIYSFFATCNTDALYRCGGSGFPKVISSFAFSKRYSSTDLVYNFCPTILRDGALKYRLPHFPIPLIILHFKRTTCCSHSILHCKLLPHLQVSK